MATEIKQLENLLDVKGKKLKKCSVRNLTAPGENYGSEMLALEVLLDNGSELNLVAKLVPPSDFLKQIFNVQVTFKKEVSFYSAFIPALQEFQRERNPGGEVIGFVPKYYGSRYNLSENASDFVDDDACLVLENMKVQGYTLGDRLKGFDMQTAAFLIGDLAVMHGVGIGLKLTRPAKFMKLMEPFAAQNFDKMPIEPSHAFIEALLKIAAENPLIRPRLNKLDALLKQQVAYYTGKTPKTPSNHFSTIIHADFWVNNAMHLKNAHGRTIKSAMLDFQIVGYGSPAHDVVFFIYSSLPIDLIQNHFDDLIAVYHNKLIKTLTDLKIDSSKFTRQSWDKEMAQAARDLELYHILFMLKPILIEKDKTKELKDQDETSLLDLDGVSDLFKEKVHFTILDFAEKGWI